LITLNGTLITPTIFPDRTSQVWKLPPIVQPNGNVVRWVFEHEAEFMHLAQLRALLPYGTTLELPYLPYARQDKAVGNDTTFALWPFLELLDSLDFGRIEIFDPHSTPLLSRLRGALIIEPREEIALAIIACRPDAVCFPDAGARARYGELVMFPAIYAEKERDQATGAITGLTLHGNPAGQSILIVDDLCDGGMTFIKLADKLYSAAASAVHLYVSHGIFSKGTGVLFNSGIQRIFTKEGEVKK
jgi:ribose-phosphate pyrophosphokinase